MNKFYLTPDTSAPEHVFSTRRIFNGVERRYLSLETRLMVYGLLDSKSVPSDVTESAVEQAVTLGSISGEEVDARTFEALFHAVALNPSFKIPLWFVSTVASYGVCVC